MSENNNIKQCSNCGTLTTHERVKNSNPIEGEVCDQCGKWFCPSCIDYIFMKDMYERYKDEGVEGTTEICMKCAAICEKYEGVKLTEQDRKCAGFENDCGEW